VSYISDTDWSEKQRLFDKELQNRQIQDLFSRPTAKKVKVLVTYFHLVAGTCLKNSLREGIKHSLSLRLHFLTKMGSSHEESLSPRLVAGTSRLECADPNYLN